VELKVKALRPGERAEIVGYEGKDLVYRQKLLSMGLTKGTEIKLLKVAPLGDPVEIEVRGFNLSLRKDEADILKIRRKSDG
jgi:ferrous iron transport protein A